MPDSIIFLGTNGNSYINNKHMTNGGFILQINDFQFHVDPGAGALLRYYQYDINPRNTLAVFVSNGNLNRCNDVNTLIDAMTHNGLDKRGVLIANDTLINGTEKIKSYLTETHRNYLEKVINLKIGQKVGIEDIDITATKALNSESNAIGFRFHTPKFNLGYVSDTGYFPGIEKEYEDCDILIINNLNPAGVKEEFNLNSEDTVKILQDVKPKLALVTGFGIKMIKSDPLYEAREISKKSGVQVIGAKDGLMVNPISFSTTLKQI